MVPARRKDSKGGNRRSVWLHRRVAAEMQSGKSGTFSGACRFGLDDLMTDAESWPAQSTGPEEPNRSAHQRQTFQERAAASPRPFSLDEPRLEAVSRCRKTF